MIKELKEALPLLSDKVDQSTYGRLTRWGAHCVLARMYLNAEVYTGTPAWNEALAECNKVIEAGKFSLEPVYRDIFKTDNENCMETIFAVPYDEVYNSGTNNGPAFTAHMKWLSTGSRKAFNMQANPWNGCAANPQFINSYDKADNRLADSWLQGPQRNTAGEVVCEYVNQLPSIYESKTYDGYRVGKYEIKNGARGLLSNDLPYFRYAEARRRTDMIRFGTYQTKSWFNHKPVGNYTTLFPIHFEDMNTNSNLKQNPGYGN